MTRIIVPSKYSFLRSDSPALDAQVDDLTRSFDSDSSLRDVVSEHYIYPEIPGSFRDLGMPAFHGRRANCLLLVVEQALKYVADYEEPVLWTPDNVENKKRVELREAWFSSPVLQEQVADYTLALRNAYFEFCKQFINHFVVDFKHGPHPVHSDEYKKWQEKVQKHSTEAYSDCDRAYYSQACRLLRTAEEKGAVLSKDFAGGFFVISPDDMTELMRLG